MLQAVIDTSRIKKTPSGEVIVPLDIWERLLKMAEEAEGWKETIYLLESMPMRERLKQARKGKITLSLEEVREKLDF